MVHLARATFACLFCLPACAQVFSIASPKPYILVGESFTLTPFLRDPAGIQIVVGDWVWTALDPAILALDSSGRATGLGIGVGRIKLTSASRAVGLFGSLQLEVQPKSVTITPSAKTMLVGDAVTFSATALDALDRPIPNPPFIWDITAEDGRSNLIPSTTAIDANGKLTAADAGHYTVHAVINYLPVQQGLPSHVDALAEVDVVLPPAYRIDTIASSDPVTTKTLQPAPGVFVGSESGQVAFTASAEGFSTAVVQIDGTGQRAVVSTGAPSPQAGGVVAGFQSIAMNSKGESLIAIKAGDRNNGAILATTASGSQFVLLDTATGFETDGKPDYELTFLSITPYCLNDNGNAVIKALYRPQDGTTADVRDGLFLMRNALSSQSVPLLLWSADKSLPSVPAVGTPPRLLFPFDNTEVSPGWAGYKGLGVDNNDTVYFIASSSQGRALFQLTTAGAIGTPQKILAQGDSFLGSTVKAIQDLIVTPSGDVVVRADLNNGEPHLVLFRFGKYVTDLKTTGGDPRALAVSAAGILFTGLPSSGKPDGLYLWDYKTVITKLALSSGVTSVSTAKMDSKGAIVAVTRNLSSGFVVARPGSTNLISAGAAVSLTTAADLKYIVKSSRAALPFVALSDPGNLFELDGAGKAIPRATAGLSLNPSTFFEGSDSFVDDGAGIQYFVTVGGLYRLSGGVVTQLIAPNKQAQFPGSGFITPYRVLAAAAGIVVVDCSTNAVDGHRVLLKFQNPGLTLLALTSPSGTSRRPLGWPEAAVDDSGNIFSITVYSDGSRDLVQYLSPGNINVISSTLYSSLAGERIVSFDHLRSAGSNLSVRAALTAEFTHGAVARFSASTSLTALFKSGDRLPDGSFMGDLRLTDANRNGEVVFTTTAQYTGTQVLGVRTADGTIRIVAANSRPLPAGEYIVRFSDVNIRDDGTVYFLAFDVNDRALVLRARSTNYAPAFDGASVLGGADYRTSSVGPGSWFVIYGDNFGQAGIWTSATTTTLGGASVTVCGVPAVMYYNSGPVVAGGSLFWQLNVLMPDVAAGRTSCPVVVTVNGKVSAAINVPVADKSLRLFSFIGGDGTSLPIVTHADYSLVGPPSAGLIPATSGESIIGWGTGDCTGAGVTVGTSPSVVQFSGRVAAGLCQINFVVPGGIKGGVPLALSSSANKYTLWIQ